MLPPLRALLGHQVQKKKFVQQKLRGSYVYVKKSFDTIFNGLWVGKIAHGLEG